MPSATTPRPILWMIAAVIGSALMGCAASADPSDPTAPGDEPSAPASSSSDDKAGDDDTKAPAFQASFQQGPDGGAATGNDDPTKDPTPAGGANQCIDTDDAGGSETSAEKLPDTDDCDTNYKDVNGVANGGVDQDWYTLAATDMGISFSHPLGCDINADFQDDTAGTELCVFGRCQNSTSDAVTGCDQGTPATSDDGMPGCCSAAPGRAVPTWNCDGLNDSMNFFIRVRQIDNGEQCLPYKLSYKF
jgi:hypothetical protein